MTETTMHPRPFPARRRALAPALAVAIAASTALVPIGVASAAEPLTLAETHLDDGDLTWDPAAEVAVTLADGASTGGAGVTVDGDTVTIAAAGTYRLSGTLTDGEVVVASEGDGIVRLILDGVSVTSGTSAALAIMQADETVLVLADGTANALTDAETYVHPNAEDTEPDAALFSDDDLTIAGTGSLTVTGRAGDAIKSDDGLVIVDGALTVVATDDGITADDHTVISGGTLTITAGGDGVKATVDDDPTLGWIRVEGGVIDVTAGSDAFDTASALIMEDGSLTIEAEDDGLHSEARLEIHGGTVDIMRSYEGLEGTEIVIAGGAITVVAQDDGLNVAGGPATTSGRGGGEGAQEGWFVEMSGGTLAIDAEGDGFDSNGSATITGGTVWVDGPTQSMNGAIDVNGELLVSDATLVAIGTSRMAETTSEASEQATIAVNLGSWLDAGTLVEIATEDGTPVVTFVSAKGFDSMVITTPDLVEGATYQVLVGGEASGERVGGLYVQAQATGGELAGTVTAG
jgi:hypothetical protein